MKQPWAIFLAIFLHLILISILVISWQQQHSILLNQANNPVVWLVKQSAQSSSQKQEHFIKTNNKNSLLNKKESLSKSLVAVHSQPAQTLPIQSSSQVNSFIKMLHDEIANQLLQDIRDNDIAVNENYSLVISFQINDNGQITNISLSANEPLPAWLSALAQRSLHEISPISLPSTQLGNNTYQIPINLELTQ